MARILVVDGGGSGFRKAVVDGRTIQGLEFFRASNTHELMAFIGEGFDADGVAFSMAGDIFDHRKVVVSPNCHWLDGLDLAKATKDAFGVNVVVANDMEAEALGTIKLFPDLSYFMVITWSSGIGLRIVKNGEILSVSEGGHMQLDPSTYAPICGCGKRGCAEALLGGSNLQKRVIAEMLSLGVEIPDDTPANVFLDQCFEAGQSWAVDVYEDLVTGMARYLANIQTMLKLPVIVWKGGVANAVLCKFQKERDILLKMRQMLMNPDWADIEFRHLWRAHSVKDAGALLGGAELFNRTFS